MIQERPQYYVFPFPNAANTPGLQQLGAVQTIDSDAPFRLYGVAVVAYGGPIAGVALRFTRPDRTWIQKILIPATSMIPFDIGSPSGAAGNPGANFLYFAPISPNVLYPPRSGITVDIQNLPAESSTNCLVIFVGTNLYSPDAVWAPQLPKTFRALPFLSYPLQILKTQLPVKNLPLNIDTDAGFVWQQGTQTDYSTGGTLASLFFASGETLVFKLTAVTPGIAGNLISITLLAPAANPVLSVAVVGSAITVTGRTIPPNSTFADIAAAILATPAAAALVTISNIASGSVFAIPAQFLFGGGGSGSSVGASQLGLIIRDWTGKPYMNDYVPAELLFGFDNAQTPGFPYPEIYIPRRQQLLIDAKALGTAGDVTTLCFKGQKIYGD